MRCQREAQDLRVGDVLATTGETVRNVRNLDVDGIAVLWESTKGDTRAAYYQRTEKLWLEI